jgi:Xaa-Pro aminopeptidase
MRNLFIIIVACGSCLAQQIGTAEYGARRARLMETAADGLIFVPARNDAPQYSESGFRQLANFYYLTGSDAFGAILVLDAPKKESWLFFKTRAGQAVPSAPNGVEHAASMEGLEGFVARRLKEKVKHLYDAGPKLREDLRRLLPKLPPKISWDSVQTRIEDLRWVKSPAELNIMRRVGWISAAAIRAGMRAVKAGRSQREVEPEVVASCVKNGAEGQSFWPWVFSGPAAIYPPSKSVWLDYHFSNRTMQAGELVYLDLGCAADHYEGDLGRTVPVSGKFTAEQREVWELLVRGYQAARAAIRPGATVAQVKKAYYDVFREAQPKSDLAKAAVASEIKEGEENKMFLLHGIGIDPVERDNGPLLPGVVLALEPMIMLPEKNMGFQLEDMLVVTEKGNDLLTAGLPYTADEIEEFLATQARSPYTTVDVHDHFIPNQHTAERLISVMNVLGISKSIIFGGQDPDNDYVLKAAAQYPDRLIPFYRDNVRVEHDAWLRNDPKILTELEREISSGRYRGIGEFTNVHYPPGRRARMGEALLDTEVSPMAPMVQSLFRLAEKYQLPVLMHNEVYYYKELDQLLGLFPKVKVIWAHAGYTSYYGVEMLMKKHPNLYADLSIRAEYRPRDSREASIFHNENSVKPLWLELIEKYPDRFMAGLDESSNGYRGHAEYFEWMGKLLSQLTPATGRKVAIENIEAMLAGTKATTDGHR